MVDYNDIPRDSRRVPLQTRVQFKFDRFSGFISEYSANISPGGLFLRTREPRPPGTVLDLEFRLGDGYELIKGRGEVIWVRAEDEGTGRPAGMGIRFLDLSEGSRELIYRIVDEHVLRGGTPFDVSQTSPDSAPPPAAEVAPLAPEPPPSSELFPGILPGPVPEPRPAPSPMFATSFGGASVQPPPRRAWPWALAAAALLLAAGGFLLRGRILEWTGLGLGEEASSERPPSREPRRQPVAGTARETSPPAPEAAPAPSAAAVPQGPVLTRLDQVTTEGTAGGTDILLWGNGEIPPATYKRARIEGDPPRELIRLAGVRGVQTRTRVTVGTAEVLQVRTGYHPEIGDGELHVVLDLAHPSVEITGIEQEPRRLRIHLRRR